MAFSRTNAALVAVLLLFGGAADDIINPFRQFSVAAAEETTTGETCDSEMLNDVIRWAKSRGAYFNPKIESRPIVGDLSGIFAKETLQKGEVVSKIPWDIIVKPSPVLGRGFCAAVETALEVLRKDPFDQTPYEKYLAARPVDFHPLFWSDEGVRLLNELIGELPPYDDEISAKRFLEDFNCEHLDWKDDNVRKALVIVMTRSEGHNLDLLIPFNDLINHRNGNGYNADPRQMDGEYALIVARRDVEAGEEISNSYNQCQWCEAFSNAPDFKKIFLTPHIFEHYGFVEAYPQRWIVPKRRLLFDVVEKDGTLYASFAIPPSPIGVEYLRTEIERLEDFANRMTSNKPDIPDVEVNGLLDYQKAILAAYKLAYQQSKAEELTDKVWYRHRKYWWEEEVKQGENAIKPRKGRKVISRSEAVRRGYNMKERNQYYHQRGYHPDQRYTVDNQGGRHGKQSIVYPQGVDLDSLK
jgi:SET domain